MKILKFGLQESLFFNGPEKQIKIVKVVKILDKRNSLTNEIDGTTKNQKAVGRVSKSIIKVLPQSTRAISKKTIFQSNIVQKPCDKLTTFTRKINAKITEKV